MATPAPHIVQALHGNPKDIQPSYDVCKDILQHIRKHGILRSDLVVHFGQPLVEKYASSLGNEWYTCLEQVYIAALDRGEIDLADSSLSKLKKAFPDSLRVQRLSAMGLEAAGDLDGALAVYISLGKDNPADPFLQKRKIAIFKAFGDTMRYSDALSTYLELYPTDHQAWLELADLYIGNGNLEQAAFCLEELILQEPHNPLYNLRFAEILYTRGDMYNLQIARKYFSQSLLLQGQGNARAATGLVLTIMALHTHPKAKKGMNQVSLLQSAKVMLLEQYKGASPETLALLQRVLARYAVDRA